jgi:hypothetical protein
MHITNKQHNLCHQLNPSLSAGSCVFAPLSSAARNTNLFDFPSTRFGGWLLCCSSPSGRPSSVNQFHINTMMCAPLPSFSLPIDPMQPQELFASVNKLIVMLTRCFWRSSNCMHLHAHHLCTSRQMCTNLCRAIRPFQ